MGRGLLCPVLPHRFVLVNSKPGTEFPETRDELATPPGMVLFMQHVQHHEPSAFPPPLPSPAGLHLDSEESPHDCDYCEPF